MEDNARAMVTASFAGDSLALGVHWIYDAALIRKTYGRVDTFLKPASDSYHSARDKGDFTHYGDQAMVLLESLAAGKGFVLDDFSARWRGLFEHYRGYVDQATRHTLARYASGYTPQEGGSSSNDLAGASRIAPLVYCCRNDLPSLTAHARAQTKMTHNDPLTIDAAEFFSTVAFMALHGTPPVDSMRRISDERFPDSPIYNWVQLGIASRDNDSIDIISRFGQSCHTPEAFPGVVHLIARHQDDLAEALVQSVMAGGDNAARAMTVGMVLGAHLGAEAVPRQWVSALTRGERIDRLLERL